MKQQTLAMQSGFEKFGRKSKRELFLEEMGKLVPWEALVALIAPHYPRGNNGRPPIGLERMLRLYFLQQRFDLSGVAKNANRMFVCFAVVNLYLTRKRLVSLGA